MSRWIRSEGYRERAHNIVYKTTVEVDGEKYYYVGKHSTDVLDDGYLGSGPKFRQFLRDHPNSKISREILSDWSTVEEALLEEERIVTLGMLRDPLCLNSIRGGGTFDTSGRVPSQKERENHSKKLKGHAASDKQRQVVSQMFKGRKSPTRGKRWVSLGNDRHLVNPEDLQKWVDAGYVVGIPETTRNGSQKFHKNSVWVHLGAESKLVSKDDLEKYFQQGYEKGRKIGTGKRVWITNGIESKMILYTDLEQYLGQHGGWKQGRTV